MSSSHYSQRYQQQTVYRAAVRGYAAPYSFGAAFELWPFSKQTENNHPSPQNNLQL